MEPISYYLKIKNKPVNVVYDRHALGFKFLRKKKRLERIKTVKRFSYNPNGDNLGFDSLSHDEVIKIGSEFIATRETMQEILVNKFPIMLIDESQDTKKELIDALLDVCE
ncbi:MAG: hypothetical protein Q4Q06_08220, partial [Bacteroidota bacterium]|nr:hypothetical protein [Bacteroidota bacterium]